MKNSDFTKKAVETKKTIYGENYTADKIKKAALKDYGVDNYMKVPEIAHKAYTTLVERYGKDFLKNELVKSALEKYGVENFMQVSEIAQKSLNTKIEKYGEDFFIKNVTQKLEEMYGVKNAMDVPELKEKAWNTKIAKYGSPSNFPNAISAHKKFLEQRVAESENVDLEWLDSDNFQGKYKGGPIYYTFKCNKCGNIFKDNFHSGTPTCNICHPSLVGISNQEIELGNYLKSIYKDEIIFHDRTILNGKELDFYFPKRNVAIEYNGTYWHGYRKDTKMTLSDFKKKVEEKYKFLTEEELNQRIPPLFNKIISENKLEETINQLEQKNKNKNLIIVTNHLFHNQKVRFPKDFRLMLHNELLQKAYLYGCSVYVLNLPPVPYQHHFLP